MNYRKKRENAVFAWYHYYFCFKLSIHITIISILFYYFGNDNHGVQIWYGDRYVNEYIMKINLFKFVLIAIGDKLSMDALFSVYHFVYADIKWYSDGLTSSRSMSPSSRSSPPAAQINGIGILKSSETWTNYTTKQNK